MSDLHINTRGNRCFDKVTELRNFIKNNNVDYVDLEMIVVATREFASNVHVYLTTSDVQAEELEYLTKLYKDHKMHFYDYTFNLTFWKDHMSPSCRDLVAKLEKGDLLKVTNVGRLKNWERNPQSYEGSITAGSHCTLLHK